MKFSDLLQHLQARQIRVWVENGKLRYNAPKGALDEELRQALRQHKAGMLEFLQIAAPDIQGIAPGEAGRPQGLPQGRPQGPVQSPAVASFAQERLWILHQMNPDEPAYNRPLALRLQGVLDTAALTCSLQEIVRRQETLRTVYRFEEEGLRPVVQPWQAAALALVDLSSLDPAERTARLNGFLVAEARWPFDLENGPVLRAHLVRTGPDEHILLVVVHHIAFDAWSARVLVDELAGLYSAFSSGADPGLAELTFQYRDFAAWQRSRASQANLEARLEYWRGHLAGAPPVIELPCDHPYPAIQTYNGRRLAFELQPEVLSLLQPFCREQGVTPFMALLAGYAALLFRYTGQEDFVIGVPVAGRNHARVEGLVGCFINTLPLRVRLNGEESFAELLQQVRETALEGFNHQELPFEYLVQALHPQRDSTRAPVFQVLFNYRNIPPAGSQMAGLKVDEIRIEDGTAPFELSLDLSERGGGLACGFRYNTDLFAAATMERLAGHFQRILAGGIADPGQAIARLPLLSAAERQQIVVEWNQHYRAEPAELRVHQMFERQAGRQPEAIAVRQGEVQVSYGELNRRAESLAGRLRTWGVGPGKLVGLHLKRSPEFIAAVLAVMKTGAAYLPIDSSQPAERLKQILADAQIDLLLTTTEVDEQHPGAGDPGAKVYLDRPGWEAAAPRLAPGPGTGRDDLAYVIYTSGSTGRPKGVAIGHLGFARYLGGILSIIRPGPQDRALQSSSLSFDRSIKEIFLALASGASLVLQTEDMLDSVEKFLACCQEWGITILSTPSALGQEVILAASRAGTKLPASIRVVDMGGERMRRELVQAARQVFNGTTRLINNYGPTETTVGATYYEVDWKNGAAGRHEIPIGRPLPTAQAFILDRWLQPAPVGVAGELYVGGSGLAYGYLRDPALSEQRFVPNPFVGLLETSPRLYRSGDRAKYLPDGNILFLGRADNQIKLNGYRIELGEIETALGSYPGVRQAVVTLREDNPGNPYLAAYVVSVNGNAPDPSDLAAGLREQLPAYMLPKAFVFLESLPLSPVGKLDYRALPQPDLAGMGGEQGFVPARTPLEKGIAGLWERVLGLAQVGVRDDFFALGGHSLLAMRLAALIEQELGARVSVAKLFQAPTIAQLAELIEQEQASLPGESPAIRPRSPEEHGPLSYTQERFWFLHQLQPDLAVYNEARAYRLSGRLDYVALENSLAALFEHHPILRTTYHVKEGRPVQVVQPAAPFHLRVVDLPDGLAEAHERMLAEADRPFDLSRGPLLRVVLFRLGEQEHILFFVAHHITSDGWSRSILNRDLSSLYAAFVRGEQPHLPEQEVQFADYALWEREQLQGPEAEGHLAYWRDQLRGAAALDLPTDRPRPPVQSYRGSAFTSNLPATLSERLKRLARDKDVTLFMTLLAGFKVLLLRYSGQIDLSVGTVIANRRIPQTEGLAGPFINTLVLRSDLSGDPAFDRVLERVRRVTLEAYEHQAIPFEMLLQELQPPRELSRTPFFQVLFVLQNAPKAELELAGVEVETLRWAAEHSKVDLAVAVYETEAGITARWEFATDLFGEASIKRMAGHYETLLEGIVAQPELPVSRLPLVSEAEREQILNAWNATGGPVGDSDLLARFARQAARPEAVAFIGEGERLTYRELEEGSNRLARRMQGLGAKAGMRIGVCLERSLAVPAVVLAIFKVGGVYVPLDPGYPTARLQLIQEDAGIRILVTRRELRERLAPEGEEGGRQPAVLLLEADEERAAEAEEWLPSQQCLEPDGPACIVYTSGSTGRPKGAVIPHGMILNRLEWMWQTYPFSPTEVGCVKTALNFIDSLWELFGYLLQGVPAVMIPDATLRSPQALVERLTETRVTQLWLVPTLLRLLLDSFPDLQQRLPHLRWWISSGEQLPTTLFERFNREMPQATLCNLYGTSEVWDVTWFHPDENRTAWSGPAAPIGKPIRNLRTYILDAHLQPAPVNVSGELWVGGLGPGNGYVDRPELTAERFLPDPFCGEAGKRMYRTGDLACWLADGNIQLLGRSDFQVKIRGFRIEPAEIEALLEQHPAIQQAVVIPFQHPSGDTRLAAYMVAAGEPPAGSELARYLRERLPEYMLPAAFIHLADFPLTPSGKIDRRSLPGPEEYAPSPAAAPVEAQTDLQRRLARIWAEVLGLPQVGIQDNFFDLGGHSLLGIQLFARIEAELGARLSAAVLFQAPTVALLAETLEQRQAEANGEVLVAIKTGGTKPPFFCVHEFRGGVLGYADLARHLDPEQPFYGLQAAALVNGPEAQEEIDRTIEAMAARFIGAMRTVQPHGPYHLGGYCFGGLVAYEMACQLAAQGERVGLVALMESSAPQRFHQRSNRFEPQRWLGVGRYLVGWVRDYGDMGIRLFLRQVGKKVRKLSVRSLQRLGLPVNVRLRDALIEPLEGLPERQRKILQIHWEAIHNYNPSPYPGKVTLFRIRHERLNSGQMGLMDPEMGWGSLAQGGVEIRGVDGFHRNIHLPPYVGSLAGELQASLDRVTQAAIED